MSYGYGIGDYGQHTYTMTYTITPFVNQYSDAQGFNWQLLNQEMNPKPAEFEATISLITSFMIKIVIFGALAMKDKLFLMIMER